MEVKGKLNHLQIAPRKVRLVTDLIRGMYVKEAKAQLRFLPNRVSAHLIKFIDSVIANAQNNFKLDPNGLFIKEIRVDEGTPFKRWFPVSRGRAFPIMKRTSCVTLVLEGEQKKELSTEAKKEGVGSQPTKETVSEEKEIKPEKVKIKPPQKIKKESRIKGLTKKIFRRKAF